MVTVGALNSGKETLARIAGASYRPSTNWSSASMRLTSASRYHVGIAVAARLPQSRYWLRRYLNCCCGVVSGINDETLMGRSGGALDCCPICVTLCMGVFLWVRSRRVLAGAPPVIHPLQFQDPGYRWAPWAVSAGSESSSCRSIKRWISDSGYLTDRPTFTTRNWPDRRSLQSVVLLHWVTALASSSLRSNCSIKNPFLLSQRFVSDAYGRFPDAAGNARIRNQLSIDGGGWRPCILDGTIQFGVGLKPRSGNDCPTKTGNTSLMSVT